MDDIGLMFCNIKEILNLQIYHRLDIPPPYKTEWYMVTALSLVSHLSFIINKYCPSLEVK